MSHISILLSGSCSPTISESSSWAGGPSVAAPASSAAEASATTPANAANAVANGTNGVNGARAKAPPKKAARKKRPAAAPVEASDDDDEHGSGSDSPVTMQTDTMRVTGLTAADLSQQISKFDSSEFDVSITHD